MNKLYFTRVVGGEREREREERERERRERERERERERRERERELENFILQVLLFRFSQKPA